MFAKIWRYCPTLGWCVQRDSPSGEEMARLSRKEGVMARTMFEHFTMKVTKVFYKPQQRIANEGVRIVHLNHDTRMNSKDKFRQGTNVMMRPTRGVGDLDIGRRIEQGTQGAQLP